VTEEFETGNWKFETGENTRGAPSSNFKFPSVELAVKNLQMSVNPTTKFNTITRSIGHDIRKMPFQILPSSSAG